MTDWKTISTTEVFANPWYTVRQDKVLDHNGKKLTDNVVALRSKAVFIIPVRADGSILLQRHYHYPIDKDLGKFPAGFADDDDDLMAAKRELLEETGLESDDWTDLGTLYSAVGIANIPGQYFLAKKVRQTSAERDTDEPIGEQRWTTTDEIQTLAKAGEFQNAPMLAALYLATLHGI